MSTGRIRIRHADGREYKVTLATFDRLYADQGFAIVVDGATAIPTDGVARLFEFEGALPAADMQSAQSADGSRVGHNRDDADAGDFEPDAGSFKPDDEPLIGIAYEGEWLAALADNDADDAGAAPDGSVPDDTEG